MPPLSAQDALSAVQRGASWRWLDVALAAADVASEPWVVALIALALFAWLEHEVRGVLKAFLPLGLALLAAGGIALAARAVGAAPRPVGAGGAAGLLLWHAFPSARTAAVAAFAGYALLAYGRRAGVALAIAVLVGLARAASGGHWALDLGGGAVAGAVLGAGAYAAALRISPRGHLARLRAARRGRSPAGESAPERPSA